MRRERARTVEAKDPRVARWIAATTILCALLGYGATAYTLVGEGGFDARRVGTLATLILAPLAVGPAVLRGRRAAGVRAYSAMAVGALQAILAARVFDLDDGTEIAAVLAAAQGHALARVPLAGASALSLVLSLGQTAAALRVSAHDEVFGLLFLQIACACMALVVLQARQARVQLARTRRTASVRADLDLGARMGFGLRLGALLVLPALLLLALTTRVGNANWLRAERERGGAQESSDDPLNMPDRIDDSGRDSTLWRDDSGLGEGVGRLSDEVVLTLRARAGAEDAGGRLRALWLTVLPLDTFEGSTLGNPDLARMREIADADDGSADGWVRVDEGEGVEPLRLEVLQRALRVSSTNGDALVRSRPMLSIQAPRVVFSPDAALVVPGEHGDRFAYRIVCAAPWSLAQPGPAQRARHPDARYVQLPEPSTSLTRIREVAETITAGAGNDLERVEAVLGYLSRGFSYSLEGSGFAGVEGVVRFLEERAGYCTAYAATSVLLLRSVGISARAVGGYLAHEHDPEQEMFFVRGRDAHAWIEVHYEGLGWRTYDPTPARARDQAFERALEPLTDAGIAAWGGELLSALRASTLGDGPQASLARVREVLAAAPAALTTSAMRAPWRTGVVLALALWSLAMLLRRAWRGGPRTPGEGLRASRGQVPFYTKLLRALERLGLRPRRGETPREFAVRVVRQGPPGLEGVPRATEIFYETRFGGQEPDPRERAFLKKVLAHVRVAAAGKAKSPGSISSGA